MEETEMSQHLMLCRRHEQQGQRDSESKVSWKPREEKALRQ